LPKTPVATQHKRKEIIARVAAHLLREGFRNSGLRALAKSAGISDRMAMYYFETKEELVAEALLLLADGFSHSLDSLLPEKATSGSRIVTALVESALKAESRPMLMLWLEIVGLAVRGDEPYRATARIFLARWIEWIQARLEPRQKHRAQALLAQVEGEVMIRLLK
jgi:AcrR family transcriptional regulator